MWDGVGGISGCPPRDAVYRIDVSTDGGKTWKPVLEDGRIIQRKPEPDDWWSQTFVFGDAALDGVAGPVRVRFSNTAGRPYMRAEAHLVYTVPATSPLKVTYAWKDAQGAAKDQSQAVRRGAVRKTWTIDAGPDPETLWVEYAAE